MNVIHGCQVIIPPTTIGAEFNDLGWPWTPK